MTVKLSHTNAQNFRLKFNKIPTETTLDKAKEFELNIYGVIIPSLNLETLEYPWFDKKMIENTGQITFETWNVNFIIDSQFKNWKMLYKWISYINNNKDTIPKITHEYQTDATLQIIDNFGSEIFRLKFINVWPQSLGEVSMSYREANNELEGNITFAYDRYELLI